MKDEEILDKNILVSAFCRYCISELWNKGKAFFDLGFFSKECVPSKPLQSILSCDLEFANFPDSEEKQVGYMFLNYLLKEKIVTYINSKDSIKEDYLYGVGLNLEIQIQLISRNKLENLIILFSDTTIEEPLGKYKRQRILKKCIKDKFVNLENRKIKIAWKDIPTKSQKHFEIIKSLIEFRNKGYISLSLSNIDLMVEEVVVDAEGSPISIPSMFGKVGLSADVFIEDKMIVEWICDDNISLDPVLFNRQTGELSIEGRVINFCTPNTIESNLIDLLVKNINSVVPHSELSLVVWEIGEEELQRKYKDGQKTDLHQRNKMRINDIRRKIEEKNIANLLEIKPDMGYKLIYTRSHFNEEKIASEIRMSEIPF
jgi:DNA-binding winged helix-turn-helix (wHTH) protein